MSNQAPYESATARGPGGVEPAAVREAAAPAVDEARHEAKHVAGEAKDQARQVAADAKDHARELVDQTRYEVRSQAEAGTKRVASGLRSLSEQLEALRQGRTEQAGPLRDYAEQARQRVDAVASRLDREGLDGVASDLTRWARRRPGLFLLACAGAGFALARLVRSQAGSSGESGRQLSGNGYGAEPYPLLADPGAPVVPGIGAAGPV